MKKLIVLLIFFCFSFILLSQDRVKGRITDRNGDAIVGANVYLKGTYSGSTSDSLGEFSINAELEEGSILVASFIGYKNFEKPVSKLGTSLTIVLKESSNNVNAVTITAGAFNASDEKKSVTLRPLDIVTIPSGEGDIYGALNTMPGAQKVGEDGRLFVRGGEGYEAKTYMDGMLVQSPYSSSMPDVPVRGRFSPFLFSGTVFSTGGYSAEFGQALSSAIVLKTNALTEKDITSISLMSVGAGVSHTKRWANTSISVDANYSNLTPYFQMVKQDLVWKKAPESFGGTMMFRQRIGEKGMIKSFSSFSSDESKLTYQNYEMENQQLIRLQNDNLYANTVYNDMLTEKWQIMSGIAYNYDNKIIYVDNDRITTNENNYQVRLKLTNYLTEDIALKFGGEVLNSNYNQKYFSNSDGAIHKTDVVDVNSAVFIETEIKISSKFAARLGSRLEYSSLSEEISVVPRLSIARKTGEYSQISLAYGDFYQSPQNDYRKFNEELKSEHAAHYIMNYQHVKNERTFRIEAYYKDYNNLVKYDSLNLPVKESYNNNGYGYAKGIDIFWRDRHTFENVDYFLSYSYVDTERDYKDYPVSAPPIYSSEHNLSFVYKQWISKLSTQVGLTYSFSTGRPYFNPNNTEFMKDRTKNYHDVSMNFSHLTRLFKKSVILHLSISNLFGIENIYGYRFSRTPNNDMTYNGYPVKPGAKRFFVLVFMLSL